MPADDLVLNVQQIAGYSNLGVQPTDLVLLQRGGLGGPYISAAAEQLVSGALASGSSGPLSVGMGAPPLALGAQTLTASLSMASAGWLMWNAYFGPNAPQATLIQSGVAGLLFFDPALGWLFQNASGSGGGLATWQTAFSVSVNGYVQVGEQMTLGRDPSAPSEAATMQWVEASIAAAQANGQNLYDTATVWSFNGRTGAVALTLQDVVMVGGAPIYSPAFQGCPTAPTPAPWSNDNTIATTAFVNVMASYWARLVFDSANLVTSFNGRTGDVTLQASDFDAAGLLNNAALTGIPTAPTAPVTDNSNQVANTAFVVQAINAALGQDLGFAPINSPNFSGVPTAPTPSLASADGTLATTAFVHNAVIASTTGVSSFNTRTGAVVLTSADLTGAGGALLAGPAFTGNVTAPTPLFGSNNFQVATTAFVQTALTSIAPGVSSFNTRNGAVVLVAADITAAGGALLAGPTFTGVPAAPTAAPGTNTTQLATTAFVMAELTAVGEVTSFNGRTGAVTFQANDLSAVGGALLTSPAFTGTPLAPTPTAGTNNTQLATTAFVMAAITGMVASFNGRTGSVTLTLADITGAGGAPIAGPVFTGVPAAPTATAGTSTTQLATTAFVQAAIAGVSGGVMSFNGRTGTVTLTTADITGAGGAPIASPAFTGTPTAATAAPGTSTGQLATTAFVAAVLASGGVTSFNGRTGAVTLLGNDLSAAGGALLASPTFTGTPAAPTAAIGTNSTQLATTAFVLAAIGANAVTTFNNRTGTVTLTAADVSAAGGPYLPTAGGTLLGVLNIAPTSGNAQITFNKAASGQTNVIYGQMGSSNRWIMQLGDTVAEGATAGGTNFTLSSYANNGAALGTPFSIERWTGYANFNGNGATAVTAATAAPGHSAIRLNKNGSGNVNYLQAMTNGLTRWSFQLGNGTVEGGNNAGSDLELDSYSDGGAVQIGTPLAISRAAGWMTLNGNGASAPPNPNLPYVNNGAVLRLNKGTAGASSNIIQGFNNGALRWALTIGDNATDSGNAGSNFTIVPYNDAGTAVNTAMSIARGGASPGQATFAVAIVNGPSDARLKGNVKPLTDCLAKVRALAGVSFSYLASPTKPEIGLIAQDVEKVVPEVVQTYELPPDDEMARKVAAPILAIDYPKLVAVLIEALKEMDRRVGSLEAAIAGGMA